MVVMGKNMQRTIVETSTISREQPKKIDLIINRKEATDMGRNLSFDQVTPGTRVI
jgi:hypothetical protein